MKNKWTELKIDNLPPDILTGDYEFLSPCGGPGSGILEIIGEMLDGEECFYCKLQPKLPSHEEIMTKWWKQWDGAWSKVFAFFPEGKEYGLLCNTNKNNSESDKLRSFVSQDYFIDRESADIPLEE